MPLIRKPTGPDAPSDRPDLDAAKAGLRSPDAEVRWKSARSLAASPDSAAALGDAAMVEADALVREAMFTSLARIGTAESVRALIPNVRSDDAERRTGAMDALKAMPQALEAALPALLDDQDPDVRVLACDLVREVPSAQATALLSDVLDREPEVNVCAAAVDVIADVGTPAALPALTRCARRIDDPFLDYAIKVACHRIGEQADRG
ncbi:MAG: HEAT repeat domain-containing protein [Phenylobacterium sp.]